MNVGSCTLALNGKPKIFVVQSTNEDQMLLLMKILHNEKQPYPILLTEQRQDEFRYLN